MIYDGNRLGGGVDPHRCRAGVPVPSMSFAHYHQCKRKALIVRVVDGNEYGFCIQHDPERVKAKRMTREERLDSIVSSRMEQFNYQQQLNAANLFARTALSAIAGGHHDAKALALKALARYPKEP